MHKHQTGIPKQAPRCVTQTCWFTKIQTVFPTTEKLL